jgi:DNA-binding XRE family transcriptional regulator
MTKSSLRERFARLGPVRDVDRSRSGSPVEFVLRPARTRIDTISATRVLAKRGLSMLRAKRVIEAAVETGEARVRLPKVDVAEDVRRELASTGIRALRLAYAMDVSEMLRQMRADLGLSQEQFALRFGFDLDALQNWEQGRRKPDRAISAYLRVIARNPDVAARAQEEEESA